MQLTLVHIKLLDLGQIYECISYVEGRHKRTYL
jgi:hypothetical protein